MWHPSLLKRLISLFSNQKRSVSRKTLKFWKTPHLRKGYLAERKACSYLQARGLTIIERNFKTSKGEIDLIARDRDVLVFIEVKFRSSVVFAAPEDAVDKRKRQTIKSVANSYLSSVFPSPIDYRFDIIAITKTSRFKPAQVRWLQNAF